MRDIDPAEPMAVFLPHAVITLVVIAIFHTPVPAHCGSEPDGFRWAAGDKVADVDVFFVWVASIDPLAFDLHRAARAGKASFDGCEWLDCGAADVDATMITIATQVKKGVLPRAVWTASRRLAVFSLVPTR